MSRDDEGAFGLREVRSDRAGRKVCRFGFDRQDSQNMGYGSGNLCGDAGGPSSNGSFSLHLSRLQLDRLHGVHRQDGPALGLENWSVLASDRERSGMDTSFRRLQPGWVAARGRCHQGGNLRLQTYQRTTQTACRGNTPLRECQGRVTRGRNGGQDLAGASLD